MIAGTYGKTEKHEISVSYGTETDILPKILSHSANFFSNILTRSHQRVLGSLTSEYCRLPSFRGR